jgi:hypothetical protein
MEMVCDWARLVSDKPTSLNDGAFTASLHVQREMAMNVPDVEFHVIALPHTTAGRKWLAKRMMANNDMFSGVTVRFVECANRLGDEAVEVNRNVNDVGSLTRRSNEPR